MPFISIDLGTTNIKTALFSDTLSLLNLVSKKVTYLKSDKVVEFDPNEYFEMVMEGILTCMERGRRTGAHIKFTRLF